LIGIHYSLPLSAAVLLIGILILLQFAPKAEPVPELPRR
jgi:hypothetical protein